MYVKAIELLNTPIENQFPYTLPAVKSLQALQFNKNITIIVGENGSGKSTLLEAIAGLLDLNLEGGSANNQFETKKSYSSLHDTCRLIKYPRYPKDKYFYRAETFYNLSTNLDDLGVSSDLFGNDLHILSRGEGFKELISHRFFGEGIYILDEPETGLSVQTQLEVIIQIGELATNHSQFIISTHSPIIAMLPNADIYEITADGIENKKIEETKMMQTWDIIFSRKQDFITMLF